MACCVTKSFGPSPKKKSLILFPLSFSIFISLPFSSSPFIFFLKNFFSKRKILLIILFKYDYHNTIVFFLGEEEEEGKAVLLFRILFPVSLLPLHLTFFSMYLAFSSLLSFFFLLFLFAFLHRFIYFMRHCHLLCSFFSVDSFR